MRWLKRASRGTVRLMQPLVPRGSRGVTILTYHLVGAGTGSPVDLPIETFRSQLCELKEFARVVSLDEGVRLLETGVGSDVRPAVVITFDDAFDNFRTRAWPLLEELSLPSTLYVPVGFIEGACGLPLRGIPELKPIAWSALRELASHPLLTIGSHSWRHRDLRQLAEPELRTDLRLSRERLEDQTGHLVDHFCYPQAKWSHEVERHVQSTYRTAVVAGGCRNIPGKFHPLRLGRVPVRRDMPAELAGIVRSTVWLEEWAANHTRAFR